MGYCLCVVIEVVALPSFMSDNSLFTTLRNSDNPMTLNHATS